MLRWEDSIIIKFNLTYTDSLDFERGTWVFAVFAALCSLISPLVFYVGHSHLYHFVDLIVVQGTKYIMPFKWN